MGETGQSVFAQQHVHSGHENDCREMRILGVTQSKNQLEAKEHGLTSEIIDTQTQYNALINVSRMEWCKASIILYIPKHLSLILLSLHLFLCAPSLDNLQKIVLYPPFCSHSVVFLFVTWVGLW